MIKVVVIGSKGRMGRRICELVGHAPDMELAAGVDQGDSLDEALAGADVAIDFTVAAAAAENAGVCARRGVPVVVGTTGLGDAEEAAVRSAAESIPVVYSPNMSIGVNVLFELVRTAARALGREFTVDIEEVHHTKKVDRPSGTAKRILSITCCTTGTDEEAEVVHLADDERWQRGNDEDSISVRSIRRGEVVGDHTIVFSGASEELTLAHHAKDRGIFAQGAVKAARWIAGRPAGLYDMSDVLGLKEGGDE